MEFSSRGRRFSASTSTPNRVPYNHPTTTIHQVNIASQTIETTVTCDGPTITQWLSATSSSLPSGSTVIIGLDIEWKPNFNKYTDNRAATLQLCVGTRCLIIQLVHLSTGVPQSLVNFLSDPEVTFVGVEVASDAAKLSREYGLTCKKVKDLREAAGVGPRGRMGLKGLAREILGLEIEKPKSVTLSNWEVRVLSDVQVRYACVDAYASYCIGHKMLLTD